MDNSKCVEYVNSHVDEIVEYVNECFDQSKEFIKARLIRRIRDELSPTPVHYEIKYVYDPYDHSGILVEDGYISLEQTVGEFLENEYSGNKKDTYESGRGWNYLTYGDEISYDTLDMASDIMFSSIRRHIENHFGENLSDDELEDIRESCSDFDDIYVDCKAYDFFVVWVLLNLLVLRICNLKTLLRKGEILMARPKSENVQINISIPAEWKKELENLARIYSVEEGETVTFLDLMRRGIQEKYQLGVKKQ